jgi:hypothetical protein
MLQHSPGFRPQFGEDSHQGFLQLLPIAYPMGALMG